MRVINPPSKDDSEFDNFMRTFHGDVTTVQLPADADPTVASVQETLNLLISALRAKGIGK